LGSICGNTFVNDAAARTVGRAPESVETALVDAEVGGKGLVDFELLAEDEPLLPQPASAPAVAAITTNPLNRRPTFDIAPSEVSARILAAYPDHGTRRLFRAA
jgi:hypothetical protein